MSVRLVYRGLSSIQRPVHEILRMANDHDSIEVDIKSVFHILLSNG